MMITKTTKSVRCPKLRGNIKSIVYPAWAEIKYDGEFDWLIRGEDNTFGGVYLVNKYGTTRYDSPVISKFDNGNSFKLLGELFFGGGLKGDLYNLLSHKTDEVRLTFRPFDLVEYDGQNYTGCPFIERKEKLVTVFGTNSICNGKVVENEGEVQSYFELIKSLNYEGIVVKNLNGRLTLDGACDWVKIKDKDRNDYIVTHIDPYKERVEYQVVTPNITKINAVKVSDKIKSTMHIGDVITIEHQGILPAGGLRHPVYISHQGGGN